MMTAEPTTSAIDTPQVFVVVPAFNEGPAIRRTVAPLLALPLNVVVVDDGSDDQTGEQLAGLGLHYLRHRVNLGQGAALQTGTSYALQRGADYVVHFDADGQHRVEDVERLLHPLTEGPAEVSLGSRFLRAEDTGAVPFARRWLLRVGRISNWLMTGIYLSDAHNGFRAMTRDAAGRITIAENRFAHATEILGEISYHKLRFIEVATNIRYTDYSRAKGQSSWNALRILMELFLGRISR